MTGWEGESNAVVVRVLCGFQGDRVTGWEVMLLWCMFCAGFEVTGWEGGKVGWSCGCGVVSVLVSM